MELTRKARIATKHLGLVFPQLSPADVGKILKEVRCDISLRRATKLRTGLNQVLKTYVSASIMHADEWTPSRIARAFKAIGAAAQRLDYALFRNTPIALSAREEVEVLLGDREDLSRTIGEIFQLVPKDIEILVEGEPESVDSFTDYRIQEALARTRETLLTIASISEAVETKHRLRGKGSTRSRHTGNLARFDFVKSLDDLRARVVPSAQPEKFIKAVCNKVRACGSRLEPGVTALMNRLQFPGDAARSFLRRARAQK